MMTRSALRQWAMWCTAVCIAGTLAGCFTLAAGGIAATAISIEDRRTTGMQVEDEGIEWRAFNALSERYRTNEAVHVNVASFNRQLLVTGEVPDATTKAAVEDLLKGVANVRRVVNELSIGPVSTLAARGNDGLITTQVKSRFLGAAGFNPIHVKVVTEAGVVHLMGLVTRDEADAAAEVARTTRGVTRVVKAFEYVVIVPKA